MNVNLVILWIGFFHSALFYSIVEHTRIDKRFARSLSSLHKVHIYSNTNDVTCKWNFALDITKFHRSLFSIESLKRNLLLGKIILLSSPPSKCFFLAKLYIMDSIINMKMVKTSSNTIFQ